MELVLNASQVLLLRKIISVFRQLTQSVHLISTDSGLELSALNSSNTAWLQVFFAHSFFISYKPLNNTSKKELKAFISAKNFYNSLTSPDNYLTRNTNHLNGLDTCIISSETELDALSFSLHFCNGLICRTTSVSYEDYPSQSPDSIDWLDYNYFRFHPQIILRCISPYCFSEDDIIWYVNSKIQCIEIKILTSQDSINRQSPLLSRDDFTSSNIKLDFSQFDEVSLVNNVDYIYSIFSIKQLVAIANLSNSINIPLALVFKDPGDPAFALFGKAAYISLKSFNPQDHILSCPTSSNKSTYNRQNDHWSGALWMSTTVSDYFKQSGDKLFSLGSRLSIPHLLSITPPPSQLFNLSNLPSAVSVSPDDTVPFKSESIEVLKLDFDSDSDLNLKANDIKDDILVLLEEFQGDTLSKSLISLDQFQSECIDTDGSISDFEVISNDYDEFSKLGCLWD